MQRVWHSLGIIGCVASVLVAHLIVGGALAWSYGQADNTNKSYEWAWSSFFFLPEVILICGLAYVTVTGDSPKRSRYRRQLTVLGVSFCAVLGIVVLFVFTGGAVMRGAPQ
jgi:hypothetical protein